MIKVFDWYIGRTILSTSLTSLLLLVGLSALFRFVEQLGSVGKGDYQTLDAILFVMFSIPRDLETLFPMSALLGGLIGIGMLANNSELIVMQASGMSKFDIVKAAMKTSLILVILVMAVGEWLTPASESAAKELRARAISGGSLYFGGRGSWAKDGQDFVYIAQVENKNTLNDISIYSFDADNNLTKITYAKSALFQQQRWLLENPQITTIDKNNIQTTSETESAWLSSLTPDKLVTVTIKPEALSINGLSSYLDYLRGNQQDSARYELAFWRKVLQPLTIVVMLLLAMSFVFGTPRSITMGARVLLGIVTGFGFHITNQIFGPVSLVYQLPAFFGALIPSVLFACAALYLLRRPAH